ncbi:MAG: hypothetical protein FWG98_07235 [Candidatus Cloacimonetes bacterium]|nr:hypothetical protein [Candidatus Cloacimonadota bacterium]
MKKIFSLFFFSIFLCSLLSAQNTIVEGVFERMDPSEPIITGYYIITSVLDAPAGSLAAGTYAMTDEQIMSTGVIPMGIAIGAQYISNDISPNNITDPEKNIVYYIERTATADQFRIVRAINMQQFLVWRELTQVAFGGIGNNSIWQITGDSSQNINPFNVQNIALANDWFLKFRPTMNPPRFLADEGTTSNAYGITLYRLQSGVEGDFVRLNSADGLEDGRYIIAADLPANTTNAVAGIHAMQHFTNNLAYPVRIFPNLAGNIENPLLNQVWRIENIGNNHYSIFNETGLIYVNGSNGTEFAASSNSVANDNSRWTITWDAQRSVFRLGNVQSNTREISFGSGNDQNATGAIFRHFASSNINLANNNYLAITLYKFQDEPTYVEGTFKKMVSPETMTPGFYMIVARDARAMNSEISGNWIQTVPVTPINNEIINPNKAIVWEITADGVNWTLQNVLTGLYVSFTGSTTTSLEMVSAVTSDNQRFSINWNSTNVAHHIQSISQNRILAQGANATDGFRNYVTTTPVVQLPVLYKLQGYDPPQVPIISNITQITEAPIADQDLTISATVSYTGSEALSVFLHYFHNDTEYNEDMTGVGDVYTRIIPAAQLVHGAKFEMRIVVLYGTNAPIISAEQKFLAGITPIRKLRDRTGNTTADLAYVGYVFKTQGVALMNDRILFSTRNEFYIQDETAGIAVFRQAADAINLPEIEGRTIEVNGALEAFNQSIQINANIANNGNISVIDLGQMPNAVINTAEYFNDPVNREIYAGSLIGIDNVDKVMGGIWPTTATANIMITDGSDEIALRVFQASDAIGSQNEPDWPVNITGVLGYFWSTATPTGNQIILRGLEDIHPIIVHTPVISDVTPITISPLANQDISIAATVTYTGTSSISVNLVYSLDGVSQDDIVMQNSGGGIYTSSIPASLNGNNTRLDNGVRVEYRIKVLYGSGESILSEEERRFFVGTTPIIKLRDNLTNGMPTYQGYIVRIQGIALNSEGVISNVATDFFLQDATGGVGVYTTVAGFTDAVEGEEYVVEGVLEQFNGRLQILHSTATLPTIFSITHIPLGTIPQPEPFTNTINYFTTYSTAENYEGSLIEIKDVELAPNITWPTSGGTVSVNLTDGTGTIALRVVPSMFSAEPSFPADIVAILSQFSNSLPHHDGYQLFVRNSDDITSTTPPPPFVEAIFSRIDSLSELTQGYYVITNSENVYAMVDNLGGTGAGTWLGARDISATIDVNEIENPTVDSVWYIDLLYDNVYAIRRINDTTNRYIISTGTGGTGVGYAENHSSTLAQWEIIYDTPNEVFTLSNFANQNRFLTFRPNQNPVRFNNPIPAPQVDFEHLKFYKRQGYMPPIIDYFNPIVSPPDIGLDISISAVIDYNGDDIDEVVLIYSVDGIASQQNIPMVLAGNEYTGIIPASSFSENGTRIDTQIVVYYGSGKSVVSNIKRFTTGITPISDLRKRTGNTVEQMLYNGYIFKVQGVSLVNSGVLSSTRHEFFIQDETAGIYIFSPNMTPSIIIESGQLYEITGELQFFGGQLQINVVAGSVVHRGSGLMPEPVLGSLAYFNEPENQESYNGTLVSLVNIHHISGEWPGASSTSSVNIMVSDFTEEIIMRLTAGMGVYGNVPNFPVNLVGILGIYEGNNQIFIRNAADISYPFVFDREEIHFGETMIDKALSESFIIDNLEDEIIHLEIGFTIDFGSVFTVTVEATEPDADFLYLDDVVSIGIGKSAKVTVLFHPMEAAEYNLLLYVKHLGDYTRGRGEPFRIRNLE